MRRKQRKGASAGEQIEQDGSPHHAVSLGHQRERGTGTCYHEDDLWNVLQQRSQIPKAACHKDASYGMCPEPAIQGDSKRISGGRGAEGDGE